MYCSLRNVSIFSLVNVYMYFKVNVQGHVGYLFNFLSCKTPVENTIRAGPSVRKHNVHSKKVYNDIITSLISFLLHSASIIVYPR